MPPKPDLKMFQGMDGSLSDWSSLKGKVIVMDFWATWCGPCLGTMPHMDDLVKAYHGKNVCFIAASIDENQSPEFLKKFAQERGFQACVGLATKDMWKAYGVSAIPTTFVIDTSGNIDAIAYPTEVTEKAIDNLLAGKPSGIVHAESPNFDTVSSSGAKPLFNMMVRPTAGGPIGMTAGGGMAKMSGFTAQAIIAWIYDVPNVQLVSDKPWSDAKFDVDIDLPKPLADRRQDIAKELLPASLGVKVTPVKRSIPVYVLTCPNGPKGSLKASMSAGGGFSGSQGDRIVGANTEMSGLARTLDYAFNSIVFDETGLKGKYDWNMKVKFGDKQSYIDALKGCGLEIQQSTREVELLDVEPVGN